MAFAAAVFVSGVGINYALKKRSVLSFAGERVVRLLYHCCLPCSLPFRCRSILNGCRKVRSPDVVCQLFILGLGHGSLSRWSLTLEPYVVRGLPVRLLYITAAGICSFKIKRLARFRIRLAEQLSHLVVAALLVYSIYRFIFYTVSRIPGAAKPVRWLVCVYLFDQLAFLWLY